MPPLIALVGVGALAVLVLMSRGSGSTNATAAPLPSPSLNAEQAYWNNILQNLNPLAIANSLGNSNNANPPPTNPGLGPIDAPPSPFLDNLGLNPGEQLGIDAPPAQFMPGDYSRLGIGAASGGRFLS